VLAILGENGARYVLGFFNGHVRINKHFKVVAHDGSDLHGKRRHFAGTYRNTKNFSLTLPMKQSWLAS